MLTQSHIQTTNNVHFVSQNGEHMNKTNVTKPTKEKPNILFPKATKKELKSEFAEILNTYDIPKDEKEQILQESLNKQELNIPISHYIQNSTSVQSFEMKDFEPSFTTVNEMIAIMNITHLTKESQNLLKKYCSKYFDNFSKFVWDSGNVTHTTAYIEINTNKPVNQKYYPIAKNAENEIEKIIDKLFDLKVLRYVKPEEPSQFLTNCFAIKRQNKKHWRFLMDAWAVNDHIIGRQTNFKKLILNFYHQCPTRQ